MERRRRRRPALALALVLAVCCWGTVSAVDVGDTGSSCANVTTVTVYKRSNSTSSSTSTAAAQIAYGDCGGETVVKVKTAADGTEVLDLRGQGVRVVESLPAVDIVRLDNNLVQSFATGKSVAALFLANNSIASLESFSLPNSLRSLDLSDNVLGSIDDANFPSGIQYLNLSGNSIGSIQNADLPSDLVELKISDGSLSSLENFSFPNSATTLNMTNNPITRIAGVIFPSALTELTIVAVAASASSTISVESTLVLYDSGVLTSVLEEFEVRKTDAELFEALALFDVSTTSTLECSDSMATPYYVQDTMLCVLSDSYFAAKYAEVVASAPSEVLDSGNYGSGSNSDGAEIVLPSLTETMDQWRSWFLIVAGAALTVLSACFCVSGCCKRLGRQATRSTLAAKAEAASNSNSATGSSGSTRLWHALGREDNGPADAETQRLLDRMMAASPSPLDSSTAAANPLDYVDRALHEHKIRFSKLSQLAPISSLSGDAEGLREADEPPSSHFEYAVAVYRHRRIALKRLFIHLPSSISRQDEDTGDASVDSVSIASKTLSAFVQEICLSSTVSHPNLIDFIGYLVERPRGTSTRSGSIALAMKYMDRGNLNDLIEMRRLAVESSGSKVARATTASQHEDVSTKAVTWEDTADNGNSLEPRWSWYHSSPAFKCKLAIAIDVARALEYMHSLSPPLFHGNLSSRKIFFNKQWDVKLGDFTSSSALRRWSAAVIETASSPDSEGSEAEKDTVIHLDMTVWSAPEVVDGRQYTERSDIYSFGILLAQLDAYECPSDLQSMIDDADVPLLNSVPRHYQQDRSVDGDAPSLVNLLMMQCRAFQSEDRPSASEVLQQLLRIDDELGKASSSSATSFY